MKIWILRNLNSGFGKMTGAVVRASNEDDARKTASRVAYGEGPETWMDPALSSCDEVHADGSSMAILTAYAD